MVRKKEYDEHGRITRHKGHITASGLVPYFLEENSMDPFVINPTQFKEETGMDIPDKIITLEDELISCIYNDNKKISYLGLKIKKELEKPENKYEDGKPKKAQISRKVSCSEPTIKYYVDSKEKIRIQKCHEETRKILKEIAETPDILLNAYGARTKKDPDSIFNEKSLEKIMDDEQIDKTLYQN